MSQFRILGRRSFPFKAISIRFAYANCLDTISGSRTAVRPRPPSAISDQGGLHQRSAYYYKPRFA